MKDAVIAFACGLTFAVGLVIAGMTEPAKVIGFLDVGGDWDPSLALVMAGAIGVFLPVYRASRRRGQPLFAGAFVHPQATAIDARLLGGAALFGLGWGAGGYCPGPAIASLGRGGAGVVVFVTGMLIGMLVVRFVPDRRR
jgi:uncharacterized membrane protein YedE/YeeE